MALSSTSDAVFETAEADTATAALNMVADHRPCCILLDYNLPDMDGLALISFLKGGHATCKRIIEWLTTAGIPGG